MKNEEEFWKIFNTFEIKFDLSVYDLKTFHVEGNDVWISLGHTDLGLFAAAFIWNDLYNHIMHDSGLNYHEFNETIRKLMCTKFNLPKTGFYVKIPNLFKKIVE